MLLLYYFVFKLDFEEPLDTGYKQKINMFVN